MDTCQCFSCGGEYPNIDGPVHRYMASSPGCWSVYGKVLAREYSSSDYFDVHRLSVDAYAVQHPGSDDRQSIQSVAVHLIRLCLFLEHGLAAEHANTAMLEAGKDKHSFIYLEPPTSFGLITAADVYRAKSVKAHKAVVKEWARTAWDAWSMHHNTIRAWLPSNAFGRINR
ncbi:DUF5946 family protein [Agaribacterium haliotis]|uniref:DUF5946 family protein n=1 Tax=Agaribacterium haliotis TaxID=2013869 RepID=UPI00117781DD|nr:DUF5946 family protein [Agaribacterium haliotis]